MFAGALLGLATALSFALTIYSAPKFARKFIVNHPFITDVIVATGIWVMLASVSQSALSAVGAAIAGLFISAALLFLRVSSSARSFFQKI
jgi:hypothetical protein